MLTKCSQKLSEAIRQISPKNPGLSCELGPFQDSTKKHTPKTVG
jgi:hypothetical protein